MGDRLVLAGPRGLVAVDPVWGRVDEMPDVCVGGLRFYDGNDLRYSYIVTVPGAVVVRCRAPGRAPYGVEIVGLR
ncbi:MAG: hypothetical protein QM809_15230 [Gordonia sp. (in: high G+C Gram-positive bacteria)]|uniref:hypothetical protein n=1 Tax=Gordonia sp. (in: high G+C Gram-positive bacteria) TaxID=84139 RepID=UPI0039E3625E